jgi:hypothetical protein
MWRQCSFSECCGRKKDQNSSGPSKNHADLLMLNTGGPRLWSDANLWPFALSGAYEVHNSTPTIGREDNKSSYELFVGSEVTPNESFQPCGCPVLVLDNKISIFQETTQVGNHIAHENLSRHVYAASAKPCSGSQSEDLSC